MNRDCIESRLDAALEKMRAQQMEVRAIYLTEKDRQELGRAIRRRLGGKGRVEPCGYAGHILRTGKHSVIYSIHGCSIVVPKRISAKVAA